MAEAAESPLNLVWLLKSQISRSAKVFLQKQSVVVCRLTRVVTTAPSQVGNAMRRRLNDTVGEAIGITDEMMTAGTTTARTDPKHPLQCPQCQLSECRIPSHFPSRMECLSCPQASVSQARQQHNQHSLHHQDIAAKPSRSKSVNLHRSLLGQCRLGFGVATRQFPSSCLVIPCIAMVFWRKESLWDVYPRMEILADLEHT